MFFIDLIGFVLKIIYMYGTIQLSARDFDFIQGWITCTDLRRKGGGGVQITPENPSKLSKFT